MIQRTASGKSRTLYFFHAVRNSDRNNIPTVVKRHFPYSGDWFAINILWYSYSCTIRYLFFLNPVMVISEVYSLYVNISVSVEATEEQIATPQCLQNISVLSIDLSHRLQFIDSSCKKLSPFNKILCN